MPVTSPVTARWRQKAQVPLRARSHGRARPRRHGPLPRATHPRRQFHYRAPPELFHPYYGPANDCDLYSSENIRSLREVVRRSTSGAMLHVLMGDGGFDVSGLENIQEVMNKQLLLMQSAAALCTLREGGHYVVKAFDLFTPVRFARP